jgi:hypothetical protein
MRMGDAAEAKCHQIFPSQWGINAESVFAVCAICSLATLLPLQA